MIIADQRSSPIGPDDEVTLFQDVFGPEKDLLRFPERLCFDKIDSVLRLVVLALARIELEFHRTFRTDLLGQSRFRFDKIAAATGKRWRLTHTLYSFGNPVAAIRDLHAPFFARVIGRNA